MKNIFKVGYFRHPVDKLFPYRNWNEVYSLSFIDLGFFNNSDDNLR